MTGNRINCLDSRAVADRLARRQGRLSEFMPGDMDRSRLVSAAVLVPLVPRDAGLQVVLTRRSQRLKDHAGQISLPGGRFEDEDADAPACALREAEEEIGLPRAAVEVVAELNRYATGTGFLVHPVVGLVAPDVDFRPDDIEVEEVFEVPLDFIMDVRNHHPHEFEHRGQLVRLYAIPYGDYFIWGATAAILLDLYRGLCHEGPDQEVVNDHV